MKKEIKSKIIHFVPLLIMMIVVFLFSAMPAGQSDATSRTIANPLAQLIHFFSGEASLTEMQDAMNWTIRKMAHCIEYMVLGITAVYAFSSMLNKKIQILLTAQLFCVFYSITDEIHQYFVPGRYMAAIDVFIDSSGVFLGIIMCALFWKIKKK